MSDSTPAAARAFAVFAHGPQQYGSHPYVYHLDAVAAMLSPYGEEAQILGYLHDVVEDTSTDLDAIRRAFGDRIAECVALLTDAKEGTREEKKQKSHAKLAAAGASHQLALIVKAADRLANLRACVAENRTSKLEMYRREHAAFRAAAYRAGLCEPLWIEIDQIIEKSV